MSEVVILVSLAAALLAVEATNVLRSALRLHWRATAHDFFSKFWGRLMAPLSDVEREVHQKVRETWAAHARLATRPLSFVLFGVFWKNLSDYRDGEPVDLKQCILLLAIDGIMILLDLCPGLLTAKTWRFWHSTLLTLICGCAAPGVMPPTNFPSFRRAGLATVFLSMLLPHSLTCLGWYCVLMGLGLLTFGGGEQLSEVALIGVIFCVGIMVLEQTVKGLHRSMLEVKRLEEKQLASNRLLHLFYDVVLELDAGLLIANGAQELVQLLSRGGHAAPPLEGALLEDLLPIEEDRQLLGSRLCRPPLGEPRVELLHVRMRHGGDVNLGHGDSLSVELFSLGFPGPAGQWRHLLGVRELDGAEVSVGVEHPTLVFNARHRHYAVEEVSDTLQRQLGPFVPGSGLYQLLEGTPALEECLQESINELRTADSPEQRRTFEVRFRAPSGSRTQLQANCSMALHEGSHAGRGPGPLLVRLTFTGLTRTRRAGTRSGSGRDIMSRGRGRGTPPQPPAVQLGAAVSL